MRLTVNGATSVEFVGPLSSLSIRSLKIFNLARNMDLLLMNGPNLNLVGKREPTMYGYQTLDDIQQDLLILAKELDVKLKFFQSNSEGEMVDCIHKCAGVIDGILINAGAYTHTSIALRDALLGVSIPYVEVHISNIYAREEFRHKSFLADKALGLVCGFGPNSYQLALKGIVCYLQSSKRGNE